MGIAMMETVKRIEGTPFLASVDFAKLPSDYIAEEYFLSGEADANGKSAAFTTRMVVIRPGYDDHFNGTVIVEWLNVSGGTDAPADWNYLHREIERSGYVYIGVSAQRGGVEGTSLGMPGALPLKKADPDRYKSLVHPGDGWAFDIISAAGRAVGKVLGSLKPKHILAVGESQSAAFLTTYVNHFDQDAQVFDGFLLHSRFRSAAPLDGGYQLSVQAFGAGGVVAPVTVRKDVRVPVLMFITETDLMLPVVGYLPARQPDTAHIRTWEVAGTAHADTYTLMGGAVDDGHASAKALAAAFTPVTTLFGQQLVRPINAALQHHYVLQAALAALNRWVRAGDVPPTAPRLAVDNALVLDSHGNASGGIRTPWMDVPTSALSGLGQSGSGFAMLFGSTTAFDRATLTTLYPDGLTDYLAKFERALAVAIDAGHILASDRDEIVALAAEMFPHD
jgi:Alpha/beta hydrolase domain